MCGRAHWRCLSGCSDSIHPSDSSGSAAAGSPELEALLCLVYLLAIHLSYFTKSITFMNLFTGLGQSPDCACF